MEIGEEPDSVDSQLFNPEWTMSFVRWFHGYDPF